MAAAAPPVHTVEQAMILCGLSDAEFWNDMSPAERVADELFDNDFSTCMDMKMEELESSQKTLAELRVNQGKVVILPSSKRKIRAFIQWTRDQYRLQRNPEHFEFPVADSKDLLKRLETHSRFVKAAKDATEPQAFTNDMKWSDWSPTFIDYLATQAGRDGQPLNYVIRDDPNPDPTPQSDFLVEYANMAPLHGPSFVADAKKVLEHLNRFIVGNTIAEGAAEPVRHTQDGRAVYQAVERKFEGSGVLQNKIAKAENTIDTLYYTGETRYMPWQKFESELTKAYAVVDKHYKRAVHADETKLRKLQKDRIRADFLKAQHTTVEADCAKVPMTMTFDTAMTIYRNAVESKYPAQRTGNNNSNRRTVAESNRGGNGGGRGNGGRHGGRGRGGRGNDRRRNQDRERNHPDQETIILRNGTHIRYHASYNFTPDEMRQMTDGQRTRLFREREEYRETTGRSRRLTNRQRDAQVQEMRSMIASLTQQRREGTQVPNEIEDQSQGQSRISEVSIGTSGSAMGGRNRSRRRNE